MELVASVAEQLRLEVTDSEADSLSGERDLTGFADGGGVCQSAAQNFA